VELVQTGAAGTAGEDSYRVAGRVRLERADLGARLRNEGAFLVLFAAAVALSFALPALKSHHAWISIPCIFHAVTGVPCLLCGMTRSFVYTAHGNLYEAVRWHMLGPAMFFIACAVCVYLAAVVVTGYRVRLDVSRLSRKIFSWSVLAIFVAFWILKLVFLKAYW